MVDLLIKKGIILLVDIYLSFVIAISLFDNYKYFLIIFIVLTLIIGIVVFKNNNSIINSENCNRNTKSGKKTLIFSFSIIFFFSLVYWFFNYPGGFNLDAFWQWEQIHGDAKYDDWHPLFTTLYYKFLTLFIDSFQFCIFIQILLFSIASACLINKIYRYGVTIKQCMLIAVFIAINPAIQLHNICLIKDVLFSIIVIVNFSILIDIVIGKKDSKNTYLGLILSLICMLLIRYNAIFYVISELISLLIINKKKTIIISILVFIVYIFLQLIIHNILEAKKNSNFVSESIGIPMAMMVNGLLNEENKLDEDVKHFLLEIDDISYWSEHYVLGEWDSCKWECKNYNRIEEASLNEIISLTIKTIKSCPQSSYMSFKENTRIIWQVFGDNVWETKIYIEPNNYGIIDKPKTTFINSFSKKITKIFNIQPIKSLIWDVGICMIIYSVLLLMCCINNSIIYTILLLPTFIYNIETMLLLAGPNHRYFYYNSIIILPIFFILIEKLFRREDELH